MANYNYFTYESCIKDKLKPILCKSCRDNGDSVGTCKRCLENQAWNREWLETHSFVFDTELRGYHTDRHDVIKTLPLRLPDEHPYLYDGIELEIEFDEDEVRVPDDDSDYYDEDEYEDTSYKINEILERASEIAEGLFVYERDGSLRNGVEFISRPCSYRYWTHPDTVDKLRRLMEYLRSQGAYINQPDTNGMHIHMSRKFFDYGNTKLDNRDTAYESFDWLFQKFQPEIEKLGGRKYTRYCEAKADKLRDSLLNNSLGTGSYNVEAEIKCTLKKGGSVPRGDHYSAVNLGCQTIEARVFKSTTDYKQILANIELVRNFAHAVREEDIKKPLNELLHTKDNLYLDEHINKVRMACAKRGEEFNIDKLNDNRIEIVVKK